MRQRRRCCRAIRLRYLPADGLPRCRREVQVLGLRRNGRRGRPGCKRCCLAFGAAVLPVCSGLPVIHRRSHTCGLRVLAKDMSEPLFRAQTNRRLGSWAATAVRSNRQTERLGAFRRSLAACCTIAQFRWRQERKAAVGRSGGRARPRRRSGPSSQPEADVATQANGARTGGNRRGQALPDRILGPPRPLSAAGGLVAQSL